MPHLPASHARLAVCTIAAVALLLEACALEQANVRMRAGEAPDLVFAVEPQSLATTRRLANTVLKPSGEGPFPALVLMHTCGGVDLRMLHWAEIAIARGYVVMVVDSLEPRSVHSLCNVPPLGSANRVNLHRGLKDAMDALSHLSRFPFVDAQRVALVGFSWGAMVGLQASSPRLASAFPGPRFAAVVSFYPFCESYLQDDTDRPLLVLMGALDDDTPPAPCISGLERLKARGAPVDWEIYPDATHAWDTSRPITRTLANGRTVSYVPNPAVTDASARRTFEFLGRHWRKSSPK